jgi:hypothetical protein
MGHIRQLGLFAGIFLSIWFYMADITNPATKAYIWLAPLLILLILVGLALRRIHAASEVKTEFTTLIRGALGVVVIAVVIFNISAYVYLKWVHTGKTPPFQGALFFSWALLAMGMVVSLAVSFVFFMLPKRKM